MELGAYAFAGAMEGLGMSLVKLGEDKKKEAERKRQEERDDRLRAEGWARDDSVRNESRSYEEALAERERSRIDGKISSAASALTGGKADFVDTLMPLAEKVGAEIGVDPRIIVAQAALETGWGKSAPNNNFFGIKSHGRGLGANLDTNEVIDGKTVRVNDSFRTYQSLEDSVRDYGRFLKENPRYREMLQADGLEAQVAALGRSGYATDPKYADKIKSIIGQMGVERSNRDLLKVAGDPDVPDAMRRVAAGEVRGLGAPPERKTAKDADGFLRYVDTGERVFPDATGKKTEQKSLSSTIKTQMKDWFEQNAIDQDLQDAFTLEVQRLVGEGMTEDAAWIEARRTANKSPDVETTEERLIFPDKTTVTPGSYDGTFGKPRGLGDPTAAADAPTLPKEPGSPTVSQEQAIAEARAAIAQGANRNDVIARLREMGIDPRGI